MMCVHTTQQNTDRRLLLHRRTGAHTGRVILIEHYLSSRKKVRLRFFGIEEKWTCKIHGTGGSDRLARC